MDLYGPPLPPGYVRPDDDDDDSSDDACVPTPSSKGFAEKSTKFIGPQCPAFLSTSKSDEENETLTEEEGSNSPKVFGPEIPSTKQSDIRDESSEDDENYGPLPSAMDPSSKVYDLNEAKAAIEKRAENMKNKLDSKHLPVVEVAEREEWMTVPDTSRKNQLGAISRCLAPAKSSSSREKHSRHSEKDKQTTEELKKYNKSKRSASLLEMHQKSKKKKEKRTKHEKEERKAFDRDEIAIKQFDKQQVNSVIDKAKFLNSRFSAGSNQYL